MQLTMSGEYAIRTMLHLALVPDGVVTQISEVSREWEIPEHFLRKISAQLASAGLIITYRGLGGGIMLGRPAAEITPLEVIEVIEGKIALNKCLIHQGFCARERWCAVHRLWAEAQTKLEEVLSSKTIAQLAAESSRQRSACDKTLAA